MKERQAHLYNLKACDMDRPHLTFTPKWEGAIEAAAINYIKKNSWRVEPEHDFSDLYQDAFLVYVMVCERYPQISTPQHFMVMFLRCLFSYVTDLANKRTKRNTYNLSQVSDDASLDAFDRGNSVWSSMSSQHENFFDSEEFKAVMGEAPDDVRMVLQALEDGRTFGITNRRRETTNEFFCRVAGKDPSKANLVNRLKAFLNDGELVPA